MTDRDTIRATGPRTRSSVIRKLRVDPAMAPLNQSLAYSYGDAMTR